MTISQSILSSRRVPMFCLPSDPQKWAAETAVLMTRHPTRVPPGGTRALSLPRSCAPMGNATMGPAALVLPACTQPQTTTLLQLYTAVYALDGAEALTSENSNNHRGRKIEKKARPIFFFAEASCANVNGMGSHYFCNSAEGYVPKDEFDTILLPDVSVGTSVCCRRENASPFFLPMARTDDHACAIVCCAPSAGMHFCCCSFCVFFSFFPCQSCDVQ